MQTHIHSCADSDPGIEPAWIIGLSGHWLWEHSQIGDCLDRLERQRCRQYLQLKATQEWLSQWLMQFLKRGQYGASCRNDYDDPEEKR
jgi:hypothetical protein